jgi:hypothetical protein
MGVYVDQDAAHALDARRDRTGEGSVNDMALLTANAPLLLEYKPEFTAAQRRFLELHMLHIVERWQWHFLETQLRAHAGNHTATIWRDELDDLVSRGLMDRGHGFDMRITDAGRAKCV